MTTNDNMKRIYAALEEAQKPIKPAPGYKLSTNNGARANDLRELLLQIHNDSRLAAFLSKRRVYGSIYDPDPDDETSWCLDWEVKQNKVQFAYQQSIWGMGRGGDRSPFELIDGRFYAHKTELVDLFPRLTASKLEDCVKKATQYEYKFRAEHP